jgi:endonuclease III
MSRCKWQLRKSKSDRSSIRYHVRIVKGLAKASGPLRFKDIIEPEILLTRRRCFSSGGTEMKKAKPTLAEVLDRLQEYYGMQELVGPTDPYEMILFANCGYPATDASCTKGYEAVKGNVGTRLEQILAASNATLTKLLRLGGIVPELRSERLKTIVRIVKIEFGGDLRKALETLLQGAEGPPDKGTRDAKKVLKKFPVVGDPGADKILLFAELVPVAAVPSAFVCVPQRILSGEENKSYSAGYRAAQESMKTELPAKFEARQRAYLLLKRHGQEICKRTKPKCDICPVSGFCTYFQEGCAKGVSGGSR